MSRFAQADTIIPGGVQGLDRYAYVNNSPIRYTDPSGHMPSDPGNGPSDWKPRILLTVNLATSIAQNRFASQLFHANVPSIPIGQGNLCGDISLEMIYETITGETNALGKIFSSSTRQDNSAGQSAYELAQEFAGSFPAGWTATAYYNSYVYNFQSGNQSHLPSSPGAIGTSLTQFSTEQIENMITSMLSQDHYVIAGVSLNTETGSLGPNGVGHFVVVTGVDSQYVYINNPYNNDRQIYTWANFHKSFQYWLLEIKSPKLSPIDRKLQQMELQ